MEAEVRFILHQALARPAHADGLGSRVQQRFAAVGGVEFVPAMRTEQPRAAQLPA